MPRNNAVVNVLGEVGGHAVSWVDRFGRFCVFSLYAIGCVPLELMTVRGWKRLLPQCYAIGTLSVPVVMLTGLFVGMVLVVQGWDQFHTAGLSDRLGAIVNISVAAELGPVLAGVMLAGRVGGALTAELGTMNVTEQLLALRSMGAEPVRYLVTPRFLSCLLLTPLLTCYADLMGALGSWAIYAGVFQGESEPYWYYIGTTVETWDVGSGLFKAFFFGGAIGPISCYKGFHCRPGAQGVGQACTQGFVSSFIAILALDFFLDIVLAGTYQAWYGFRSLI
jgi:phospholipid/cholesterol/gamma-HCH transport system permease protein